MLPTDTPPPNTGTSLFNGDDSFCSESEYRENLRLAEQLGGHWPEYKRIRVYPDDVAQKLRSGELTADALHPHIGWHDSSVVTGTCDPKCGACAHRAAEEEAAHDRWGGHENGIFDSGLGESSTLPNAGVAMGEGIGGRVFHEEPLHADPFGCGVIIDDESRIDPKYVPSGKKVYVPMADGRLAVSSREEFMRIIKGDLSMIPPHDPDECEWSSCPVKGCRNHRRFSLRGRLLNKLVDVAEALRFNNAVFAGAAATRKIAQAGIPPLEMISEVFREITSGADVASSTETARMARELEELYQNDQLPLRPHPLRSCLHPLRSFPRVQPLWDAPGADDLLPVEDHLDKYYVGIFR